jgi:hypothetical protein
MSSWHCTSKIAAVITATGGGEPNEAQITLVLLRERMLKLKDVLMEGGGGGGGGDGPKAAVKVS